MDTYTIAIIAGLLGFNVLTMWHVVKLYQHVRKQWEMQTITMYTVRQMILDLGLDGHESGSEPPASPTLN